MLASKLRIERRFDDPKPIQPSALTMFQNAPIKHYNVTQTTVSVSMELQGNQGGDVCAQYIFSILVIMERLIDQIRICAKLQ
jgi:hypothetical protein